jgi:hypothetical protein
MPIQTRLSHVTAPVMGPVWHGIAALYSQYDPRI